MSIEYPLIIPQHLLDKALELGEIDKDTYEKALAGEMIEIGYHHVYVSKRVAFTTDPPETKE